MSMNVSENRTVTTKQLKRALGYCIKAKRPAMIHGSPGTGKSDVVSALCSEMGGILYDMRLGQCEQTDLRGMPFYNKNSGKMEWAPPVDLPDEETASQYPIVFLFLDELNTAAPSVQAAAYQLILNRRVGTYTLPDNCVVLAAGNKDSDRGVTYRMPTPLANRFVHFELRVDFDAWNDWANEHRIHKDVVGYLNFSKNSLCDFDPKSASKAFATPRSWEFVSQLLDDECDENTATDIIAGTVGEGLALKFLAHRKHASKLPNPKKILDGSVTELTTKEISVQYSLMTSLVYELKDLWDKVGKTKDEPLWHQAADNMLAFIMNNVGIEIQVMGMRTALQNEKFNLPFTPKKLKNFQRFHDTVGKIILKAASN
jgi:hypothetical protein